MVRRFLITATLVFVAAISALTYANLQAFGFLSMSSDTLSLWCHKLNAALGNGTSSDISRHIAASIQLFNVDDPGAQRDGLHQLESEFQNGSAYAAGKLGWAYQLGRGVETNEPKAIALYEYAASRGMTYWQFLLSHTYEFGLLGLERDSERAQYWLTHEDKRYIAIYECWVADYYGMGIFPLMSESESSMPANVKTLAAPQLTQGF